jgi:hypothetical protein
LKIEEVAADEHLEVLIKRGFAEGDSEEERAEEGATEMVLRSQLLDLALVVTDDDEFAQRQTRSRESAFSEASSLFWRQRCETCFRRNSGFQLCQQDTE